MSAANLCGTLCGCSQDPVFRGECPWLCVASYGKSIGGKYLEQYMDLTPLGIAGTSVKSIHQRKGVRAKYSPSIYGPVPFSRRWMPFQPASRPGGSARPPERDGSRSFRAVAVDGPVFSMDAQAGLLRDQTAHRLAGMSVLFLGGGRAVSFWGWEDLGPWGNAAG